MFEMSAREFTERWGKVCSKYDCCEGCPIIMECKAFWPENKESCETFIGAVQKETASCNETESSVKNE